MYIGDKEIPADLRPDNRDNSYLKPVFSVTLTDEIIEEATKAEYKRVRALMVPASIYDRKVLA